MIRKLQQSIHSKLLAKLAISLHSAKTLEPQFLCLSFFSYRPRSQNKTYLGLEHFSEIEDQANHNERFGRS